jgi:hypothetical protein
MGMFVGVSVTDGPASPTVNNKVFDSFFDFFVDAIAVGDHEMFCDLIPFWDNESGSTMTEPSPRHAFCVTYDVMEFDRSES